MATDLDFERSIYNHAEAAPPGGLFETFADKALRRLDDVLGGRDIPWPPTAHETAFLRLLRGHQGKARAVALRDFSKMMLANPRAIKELVQSLRYVFGIQIGASREGDGGGYYLCATYEESVESTEQMLRQAVSMLKVVNRMRGTRQTIDELLHQLRLDLTQEDAHARS